MIKKKIWLVLALLCFLVSSLYHCSLAFADSGGGGHRFGEGGDGSLIDMGDLETLADELQDAIDQGKIDPTFDTASFTGSLGCAFSSLCGATNPLAYGAVSAAVGAVAGSFLSDMRSVKDQDGNFGYSIGADAASAMYDEAVKTLAQNSTYSASPIILPRGYTVLDTANMTYDSGSAHIGDYPVMYGSGRDNNWPVQWYFTMKLLDTTYVWNQNVITGNSLWTNGTVTLYAYSADGTQDKGFVSYPSDGATANNWRYSGAYVPLITGNSFIAWTTQADMYSVAARQEVMIRNPWLDTPTIISHDSVMNTDWTSINTTNYTTLIDGGFTDVSSLLAALNDQTAAMEDLLLNVQEVIDTLQEILEYQRLILERLDKWFPDYDLEDLPPIPDVSVVARDYELEDAVYDDSLFTGFLGSSIALFVLTPLFVAGVAYALFGKGT